MTLFNLSILNTFIEAYKQIRKHKNKGQAEDDEIDRKCNEIKQKFADAGNNPESWVELFSYLGGIADGSQNKKFINHMPSVIRTVANLLPTTQYTETQSDLSQAIWALIHHLHRIIFETKVTHADDVKLQTHIRAAIDKKAQELRSQRDTAFQEWNVTFMNTKASDAEVGTKADAYYKLEMELVYLGDSSHLCVVAPHCFYTYDKPAHYALGVNTTDPMQGNHRLATVLHKDYDRFYISKVMLEDDRKLLESYQHPPQTTISRPEESKEGKSGPSPVVNSTSSAVVVPPSTVTSHSSTQTVANSTPSAVPVLPPVVPSRSITPLQLSVTREQENIDPESPVVNSPAIKTETGQTESPRSSTAATLVSLSSSVPTPTSAGTSSTATVEEVKKPNADIYRSDLATLGKKKQIAFLMGHGFTKSFAESEVTRIRDEEKRLTPSTSPTPFG